MTMWSIDSNGTQGFNDYLNRLLAPGAVQNGSIILLHFTTFSVNNISALIDSLTKRGLELVTVSELFADYPPAAHGARERNPRFAEDARQGSLRDTHLGLRCSSRRSRLLQARQECGRGEQ